MALTSTKVINTRSPYFIKVTTSYGARLKLYVATGNSSTLSSNLKYTIEKDSDLGYVVFDISELIRDYYNTVWNSTSNDSLWVRTGIATKSTEGGAYGSDSDTDYIAVDGYGNFSEGINPRTDTIQSPLQTNTTHYYVEGEDIKIPVMNHYTTLSAEFTSYQSAYHSSADWEILDDYWDTITDGVSGNLGIDLSFTSSNDADTKIKYIGISTTDLFFDEETLTVTYGVATKVLTLKKTRCSKYTPIKLVFYNRHGALQELWFINKSVKSFSTTAEDYSKSIVDYSTLTYDTYGHQKQKYMVNGSESMIINTDFIDEGHNAVFEELMLSEYVWLDENGTVLPVNITTDSLEKKTSVNDGLIQYSIEVEFAFDKINEVR
jgi:hypothetical protein